MFLSVQLVEFFSETNKPTHLQKKKWNFTVGQVQQTLELYIEIKTRKIENKPWLQIKKQQKKRKK